MSGLASAAPVVYAQAQIPPSSGGPPAIIATLPFDGHETTNPPKRPLQIMPTAATIGEALMARTQSRYYRVLSPELFGSIARIKYHGRAPDLRSVARLLKANILIGGWLEATPTADSPKPYRLTLTLYDSEGQIIGQLGYDLDTPVLNAQRFTAQATAFFQMLDGALRITSPAGTPGVVATLPQQPWQAPPQTQQWQAPQPPQQWQAQPQPQQWQAQPQPPQQWQAPQQPQPQQWQAQPPPQPVQPWQAPQPPQQWQAQGQSPSTQAPTSNAYQGQPAQGQRMVNQADDREEAPLSDSLLPKSKEAKEIYDRRPPWQSAFDVELGYMFTTRTLTNEGSDTSFPRAGASGLFINAELHPLAFLRRVTSPVAGLGLRVSAMVPFWPTIEQVSAAGTGSNGSYQASEHRVDFALRWHWNFWNDLFRPDFEVEGLFGDHGFEFSQPMNLPYLSLPSADYRYLGVLVGMRMWFTRWLSGRAAFTFAKNLSLGNMTTPAVDASGNSLVNANGYQSYGPGTGWLWRADLGLTAEIWRGIIGGFNFYYEANSLTFDGQGAILQNTGTPVTRAKDEYLGIMLTLGYYFRSIL